MELIIVIAIIAVGYGVIQSHNTRNNAKQQELELKQKEFALKQQELELNPEFRKREKLKEEMQMWKEEFEAAHNSLVFAESEYNKAKEKGDKDDMDDWKLEIKRSTKLQEMVRQEYQKARKGLL